MASPFYNSLLSLLYTAGGLAKHSMFTLLTMILSLSLSLFLFLHAHTHTRTLSQGESHQAAAMRAFHPDEVAKQAHLEVDTLYYLQHQVHAVVSRLCEPIQGLDAACIAECLGKLREGGKGGVEG